MPNTTQSIDAFLRDLEKAQTRQGRAAKAVMPGSVAAAANGLTFGFADEAVAGVRSLFGTPYREALEQERASREDYAERHPYLAAGAELAGSLPTLLIPFAGEANAARAGAQALGTGARLARAARTGAVAGAAGGALQGVGEAESNAGIIPGALVGGAVGGALGGAGGALVEGAAPVVRGVREALDGVRSPQRAAERTLAGMADEDVPGTGAARRRIEAAATQEAVQQAEGMPATGRTLAEVVGPNARGALEGLAMAPGRAMGRIVPEIERRAAGRQDRVLAALRETFGDAEEAYTRSQQLFAQRSADADPLYAQIRAMDAPLGETEARLWARAQPAAGDARTIGTLRGETIPGDGNAPLTVAHLMAAKDGLNQLIERESRQTGRMSPTAVEARRLRDQIVDRLDEITTLPDGTSLHRQARELWAGPSANLDALELGREIFRSNPAEMRALIARMSEVERQHFVEGGMNALRERLSRVTDTGGAGGANPINAIAANPQQREALRVLTDALGLPPAEAQRRFQTLARYLRTESDGVQAERDLMRNSATARRQAFMSQLAPSGIGAAIGAAGAVSAGTTGNPAADLALGAAGGAVGARALATRRNDALAALLATRGPAEQAQIAARIDALQRLQQRRQAGVPDRLTGQAGLLFGAGPPGDEIRRGLLD